MSREITNTDNPYLRIVREILTSPIDCFDYYLNGTGITRFHLFFLHILLWVYAFLMKSSQNLILLKSQEGFLGLDKPEKWNEGVLASVLVYPVFLVLVYLLDLVRRYYQETILSSVTYRSDLPYLSFLPMSATSIFQIFPKPINYIFLTIGILYSFKVYYLSLRNLANYEKKDFLQMLLYFGILIFSLSFIGLLGLTIYRSYQ
ncbi:MAG: hypothetical protein SFU98_15680 [Leptospiraceae bacterium]|nr:hypothetical protein [Leptospiraceae bacterium]